jgi:hypothetical protein
MRAAFIIVGTRFGAPAPSSSKVIKPTVMADKRTPNPISNYFGVPGSTRYY